MCGEHGRCAKNDIYQYPFSKKRRNNRLKWQQKKRNDPKTNYIQQIMKDFVRVFFLSLLLFSSSSLSHSLWHSWWRCRRLCPSNRCRRSCSSLYIFFLLFVGAHKINVVAECHAHLRQPHLLFVVRRTHEYGPNRKKSKEKLVNILKWILCYPAGVPTVPVCNFLVEFFASTFSLSLYLTYLWRTFVFQRTLRRVSNCWTNTGVRA